MTIKICTFLELSGQVVVWSIGKREILALGGLED